MINIKKEERQSINTIRKKANNKGDVFMKISIIGTGYVGLVCGACLVDFGMNIICMDNDVKKIDILNKGEIPIFEPGLPDLVKRNLYYKRLEFTTSIKKRLRKVKLFL